ncbi:MAG: hypothetical protein AB8A41_06780 [Prochlorococcus sp.]
MMNGNLPHSTPTTSLKLAFTTVITGFAAGSGGHVQCPIDVQSKDHCLVGRLKSSNLRLSFRFCIHNNTLHRISALPLQTPWFCNTHP